MRTPDLKHELHVYPEVFARKGHKQEVTSEKGPKRVQYCNYWGNWWGKRSSGGKTSRKKYVLPKLRENYRTRTEFMFLKRSYVTKKIENGTATPKMRQVLPRLEHILLQMWELYVL